MAASAVAVLIFDNVVVKVDGICTTFETKVVLIIVPVRVERCRL